MTVQKDEQITKRVDFVAKDEAEQIATGIVMVPDKVDLQGDYAREDTIRSFAEQFETFAEAGEADGGIMHAAWPDDWMALERNEVLDEAQTIGGVEAPAGAWIQSWQFTDDDLWQLVADDILAGYSIGAIDVRWSGPVEEDNLPDDVSIAEDYDGEMGYWEMTDGIIREVSAVDVPAVPDAQILEAKDAYEKRLADYLGDRSGFIEEAMERGHSEADAERLWDVLNEAIDVEGAKEPGKQSVLARAGKAFLGALTGSDDGADVTASPEAPDTATAKEGRTLSKRNRDSLFATIDASLDVLQDAGVEHGMTRFTDREDLSFDLSEHQAREWACDEDDEDEDMGGGEVTDPIANHAPDGDTSDDSTTMSDDDTGGDKSLAEQNAEQIADLTAAIDDLAEKLDDDEAAEKDGEPDDEKTLAEQNAEKLDEVTERIDAISKQTGATESQQLGGAEKGGDEGGIDKRAAFFTPESKLNELAAESGGDRR